MSREGGEQVVLVWETHPHESFLEGVIAPGDEDKFLRKKRGNLRAEGVANLASHWDPKARVGTITYKNKHQPRVRLNYRFELHTVGACLTDA